MKNNVYSLERRWCYFSTLCHHYTDVSTTIGIVVRYDVVLSSVKITTYA